MESSNGNDNGNASIVLYRTNNVCNGDSVIIKEGEYNFGDSMWQPALAKVEPLTTLMVYFSDDKKLFNTYNNPYSDRYVVIRLQNEYIKCMKIETYAKCAERLNAERLNCENTTIISSTDIIIIILILSLIILFRW